MQSCFYKQEQSETEFGKCHSQSRFNTDFWVWNCIVHISEGLMLRVSDNTQDIDKYILRV